MNWFDQIEQRRKLLIGGITLICLVMLVVTVRRNNVSYDSFWHLKMGLDWLEYDLSLWLDHFSFTFNGKEIASTPYIFQAFLAWLVTQLGLDPGFEAYKLVGFLLSFSLVLLFLHQLRSPAIIYCLVLPLLVVLLQMRAIVRPELISYSFSIVALMLYYRVNNKMSVGSMLPIATLMLVWSNYHSSILGYIIFFGLFIDLALQQIRQGATSDTWVKWLLWGLLVVAVGFIQPGFSHTIIGALFFPPEWKTLILEYQSPLLYKNVPAIYSLIAICLITVVLLIKNRQFGLLFISLLLIYLSLTMSRMVTPSGIVILCVFAWTVSEIDIRSRLQQMPTALSRITGVAVGLVFFVSLVSSVDIARSYMKENRIPSLFPVDVADYMIDHDIQGRIFNNYGIGGYLIYRLSPDSQVYIDGRTGILYPLDHFYDYMNAERSAELLRTELKKYDIKLAVLQNQQRAFPLARDTGMLGLDYVGHRYSLFRSNNPNFPVLGTLLASPACWNPDLTTAIEAEQTKAEQILPSNSYLKATFIQYMIDYSNSPDKGSFLSKQVLDEDWPDYQLRFTAYQALRENLDSLAYDLFLKPTDSDFGDHLGAAVAQARLEQWKRAEQILDNVTRKQATVKPSEIKILHDLLLQIRQNSKLELFDNEYIERIAKDLNPENQSDIASMPDVSDFCPEI